MRTDSARDSLAARGDPVAGRAPRSYDVSLATGPATPDEARTGANNR